MDSSPNYILRFAFLPILLASGVQSYSQNLIPNPSFETFVVCPSNFDGLCNDLAPPWDCGTTGTCDYYNACDMGGLMDVPYNAFGFQIAHSGDAYAGGYVRWGSNNYREYILVPLINPLVAGSWYHLDYYISLINAGCGIERIGAYFSATNPFVQQNLPLSYHPQLETNYGYLSDTTNWVLITGCFQAEGGEAYMLIGNFHNDAGTPFDPDCMGPTISYYYYDDFSLTEGDAPDDDEIDLGGPIEACFEYTIDPGIDGLYYIWSDGSNEPTLTVSESGLYSVTITDGCSKYTGEIDVTIFTDISDVEIGPEEITICAGDSYVVSIDPLYGDVEWNDGSHELEYTISSPGLYSVSVDNGCSMSSDQILVSVLEPPSPINLGPDVILCFDEEISIELDPTLGDFTWQDGATDASYLIEMGGVYSVTISNQCGEASDELIITDLEIPDINLGEDSIFLCNNQVVDFAFDPDLGDFLWQDGYTGSDYSIFMSGTYSLFVTNMCGTGNDQIEVVYADVPYFDFGPDQVLCPGQSLVLEAGGISGEYAWQDNALAHSYNVITGGLYSLTVTNFCGEAVDSIQVSFASGVTPPDLGANLALCPGEKIVFNVNSSGAFYLWQDGSTADSFLITTSGTYFVKVYNACESFSDTVQVIVNSNPPQLDLPASIPLCQGSSSVLAPNISGVTYLWNDASLNDSLLVSTPGTYSLTVTNACGTDTDTVIVIDNGPLPSLSLGNDISICPGDQFNIHPQFSDIDTWLWQDGSTDTMYSVTSNEIISVIASNACGVVYDTLIATLLPATPPITLGNDTSLCSGQSFVLTIPTPNVNILWSDGTSNNTITVDQPGQVFATISNVCGENADTIVVISLPDIPELNLGIDQLLCLGEVILLSPFIPNVSYLWNDGTIDTFLNATQQGIISLTISNSCGSSTDSITISESNQGPQVYLGPDILGCEGDVVNLMSDISGVNYVWQDGSILSSYSTSSSGTFILSVSNNCGTDADTVEVDIHGLAPQTNLGVDTTLCEGKTLTLASSSDTETTIEWQNGSTSPTFVVTSPGMYSISESNHCGSNTDTIKIDFLNVPIPFSLGPDTTLCPGESLMLIAPLTTDELAWQDGSDLPMIIADKAQNYSLSISNECGTVADNFTLSFDTKIPVVQLDPKINLCPGDLLQLDVTQLFPATYAWSTGQTIPIIQINTPGAYVVTVATPCALVNGETEIEVDDSCFTKKSFYIPNVFSPNGDGINDAFTIQWNADLDVRSLLLSIFDRWGNLVYTSTELSASWNGKFKDDPLNPGVYVYQIELHFMDQGSDRVLLQSGDVTLIR